MIYLYVKTHNKTGLKYLGKTTAKDPNNYRGSGTFWIRHIKKHSYDVTTEIIFQTEDVEELAKMGKHYSDLYNVVASKEWANLKEEVGDGGWDFVNTDSKIKEKRKTWIGPQNGFYGKKHSEETKRILSEKTKKQIFPPRTAEHNEKIKKALTGKLFTDERKKNISDAKKGKPAHNKGLSDVKVECPHCKKTGGRSAMKKWHFDKCKMKEI
jgi:hypothetical protein